MADGARRSAADPYAAIAAFYDAEFEGVDGDAAFYARHAASGPLLVGGCGTGRLVRKLRVGREVVGLDRSAAMLEVARARDPGGTYLLGDLAVGPLPGPFGEVALPNATFNFMGSRAEQLRCLTGCHGALVPGGTLTLDLPLPVFSLWARPHDEEQVAWTGRVDGREAVRTRETRRWPARQALELTDRYYVDGQLIATSVLPLRIVMPAEVEWMVEAAGFWVDAVYGDHAGRPLGDDSPRLLVRAVAAPR